MTDMTLLGLPIVYLLGPIFLFGPIVFFVAYTLGLGGLFKRREGPRGETADAIDRRRARENRRLRDGAWFLGTSTVRRKGVPAFALQAVLFTAFAAFIAVFSDSPDHRVRAEGAAMVKLTMSYPPARKEACRKRSREELQKMPPNMRAPNQCSRQRWLARVTIRLDGDALHQQIVSPSGLSDDGPSVFYARFSVPAGQHTFSVRLEDMGGTRPAHELERTVVLEEGVVFVVGFDENEKKITLQ